MILLFMLIVVSSTLLLGATTTNDPFAAHLKMNINADEYEVEKTTQRSSRIAPHAPIFFTDPNWHSQWNLNRGSGLDMNVIEAWNKGFTGAGVVVAIVDDGLETTHPDLIKNYDPIASHDYNDNDADPTPRYDKLLTNHQGTRCAGVVASQANNSFCGVGIAFDAKIGGIRMLDGYVNDSLEASSLSHNPQHIDIYSIAWGPVDDGATLEGPGPRATAAMANGIRNGRKGLGSIYIWAAGLGGQKDDDCNCDVYVTSMWTIAVNSVTESGQVPYYAEHCSSILATTYSGGKGNDRNITTTDLNGKCTSEFAGTSVSAPTAAGIVALALQANSNLGWRDVQHIIVATSSSNDLNASDWSSNGVGRNYSHFFGFGLINAGALVTLAQGWKTVPAQNSCRIQVYPFLDSTKVSIGEDQLFESIIKINITNCPKVGFLEHVQLILTMSTPEGRGDVHVTLTSPSGTLSKLLSKRRNDYYFSGFDSWTLMSVHYWGENPAGEWVLRINNPGSYPDSFERMTNITLVLHGIPFNPNTNTNLVKKHENNRQDPAYVSDVGGIQ